MFGEEGAWQGNATRCYHLGKEGNLCILLACFVSLLASHYFSLVYYGKIDSFLALCMLSRCL